MVGGVKVMNFLGACPLPKGMKLGDHALLMGKAWV